jgi:hypothetical protein
VAIWCARNETAPTAAFLNALKAFHTDLDGTRTVLASSGSGSVHSGGPYTYTSPANCYAQLTGFHTELGGQCVPSYESVTAMGLQWPVDQTNWSFHDFCVLNAKPTDYTNVMTTLFGTSSTLQEFCGRAQLMNYDAWRAYFEALQAKRFNGATGLLLWMSNCVWPSLVWQTYDYYLEGTGAMYGSQKGSEPVHIMYYGTGAYNVSVVNNTAQPLSGLTATGTTYNLDGTKVWSKSAPFTVAADAANTDALGGVITKGTSTPYFLDLKLTDAAGKVLSKNFYWLPSSGTDISKMLTMTKAPLEMSGATAAWTKEGPENVISCHLVNKNAVCAVACRLKLMRSTGERILPCHYNDNYFSLAPGDTQQVEIRFDDADKGEGVVKLTVSGINVEEKEIPVGAVPVVYDRITNRTVPQATASYASGRIRLHHITAGSPWSLRLIDMHGRMIAAGSGRGNGDVQLVATPVLRTGVYIALIGYDGRSCKSVVTKLR